MRALLLAVVFLAGAPAWADPAKSAEELDIEGIKSQLIFLHDGRGHYVAVVPFKPDDGTFYGDGKTFYQQRVFSYSHDRSQNRESRRFWAPTSSPSGGDLERVDSKWTIRCSDRYTPLLGLDEGETRKLLDRAVFKKTIWKRQAAAFARDQGGTYYLVDRLRDDRSSRDQWADPHPPTGFRLFIGRKGRMRPQKVTDTTVDSKGFVLATRKGSLSVDDSNKRMLWSRGKRRTELLYLPVEDNTLVIYRDLRLYGKLGIPCDHL